ncbi:ABC transporter substrate-binding protein [Pseudovibrio sp. Ad26]|uniref:ABC transporter substrate-binding protein n=1 Tax=Pseudovibrio sp. Ad26 TaxID=989410 RepID=UPI0007AE63BF|nr:ABC transporter substrate-binding protein [Pseudovibrio sp. Ad26]KZL12747.1 putative ABC transporter-binding protein precursor [Pseudovibrio sp. Ad26]
MSLKRSRQMVFGGAVSALALVAATAAASANQCSAYNQAPLLDQMSGLPTVAERLPVNPLVVDGIEGIGTYGGEMTDVYAGSRIGDYRRYGYDPLVRWSPDGSEVLPNIAESWDISADATTYTFKLREGLKWSDGKPFSAKDIQFWWDHIETNREINPKGPRKMFIVNGEEAKVEALDDTTVRFSWSQPNGVFMLDMASPYGQRVVQFAEHYVKDFMKDLNPDGVAKMMADAGEADFGKWWLGRIGTYGKNAEHNDPNRPTMLAWRPMEAVLGKERFTFERNPYYWKVDSSCNQLPYIDKRTWVLAKDPEVALLKTVQGEIDISPRNISTPPNRSVFFDNKERGGYRLVTANSCNYNNAQFMFAMNHPDPVKAQVFQSKDFRIGLSLAMDRDLIIDAVYLGQGEPYQVSPRPESPYYNDQLARQYTEFDPDLAAEHLDKILPMGPDGKRVGPDGKPFKFIVHVNEGFRPDWVDMMQIIAKDWQEQGLEVVVSVASDEIHMATLGRADKEITIWVGENGCGQFPLVNLERLTNFKEHGNWEGWDAWHDLKKDANATVREGVVPTEPPAGVKRMYEITDLVPTKVGDEQTALMEEFMQLSADNFLSMGIALPGGGFRSISNKLRNVPDTLLEGWLYPGPAPVNFSSFYINPSKK